MATITLPTLSKISRSVAPAYKSIAPESLRWAQEKEFFRTHVTKHWQIAKAIEDGVPQTVESCKIAVRETAAMGLSMNPLAQLVYFIPRRARKQWDRESKADYERNVPWLVHSSPSYRGLAFVATVYGSALDFAGEVVYRADAFEYRGPMQMPYHKATRDPAERSELKAEGVYAIARMPHGIRCEYIDAATIQKIRAMSDRPGASMWTTLWTEGWKKAAVRRLSKLTMATEPRMIAAEQAMQRVDGITFNQDGQPVQVPRETSQEGPEPAEKPRGMSGLRGAMETAQARQAAASEPDPDGEDAIIAGEVPSEHPPGAIEWWADQIAAADSLERLDVIRATALNHRMDQGEDADVFRDIYARRHRTLKAGASQ